MDIAGKEYELISFNRKITNKKEATIGLSFAQGYLAVADNYRIYNTKSGEPIIRGKFQDIHLCLWWTSVLEKIYRDYFQLWEAYPTANIISWCKYSVEDGAIIFEIVEYLKQLDIITKDDIDKAIKIAEQEAKKWRIHD